MNSTWYVSFEVPKHSNGSADKFPEQQNFKVNQKPRNSPASNTRPDCRSMLVRSTLTSLNEQSPGPMFIAG